MKKLTSLRLTDYAKKQFDSSLKCQNCEILDFLTKPQLASKVQISKSFIDKLMAEEGLPHFKIGRSVRFKKEEVMAFLERRRRP